MKSPTISISECIVAEIRDAVGDLATQNWPHISRILDTDPSGKIGISFSVEVDRTGSQPKVTTRISYAERHKDERESYIEDPRQLKLMERGEA